jgi:hypothetical protein
MKCPKCRAENPEAANKCNWCGSELNGIPETTSSKPPKVSLLAVSSLILGVLSIFTLCLTTLPAIIVSAIALSNIRQSHGRLKGRSLAIAGLCISLLALPFLAITGTILWSMDAPPVPNDYTIADLQSAGPEYDHTYELLLSLSDDKNDPNEAPAIGLNIAEVDALEQLYSVPKDISYAEMSKILTENADTVRSLWQSSEKGQDVIRQLSSCEQIADLTEPRLDSNLGFLYNYKKMSQIYRAHAHLEGLAGNDLLAARKLAEIDIVFRKLSINARSIITKLVCYALIVSHLDTANFLVNKPDTTDQTLRYLADNFPPLIEQQVSLINASKNEYLTFKNILSMDTLPEESGVDFPISKLAETNMLKLNSSLRLHRNICDEYIQIDSGIIEPELQRFSVWPTFCPLKPQVSYNEQTDELPWYYWCYNPMGTMLVYICAPAWDKIFTIKKKIVIMDDLFQIVLAMRMSSEYSLKARAYGDDYIIDLEKKIIYSPGPDGEHFTDDDIKLEINPDVLGLTEQRVDREPILTE